MYEVRLHISASRRLKMDWIWSNLIAIAVNWLHGLVKCYGSVLISILAPTRFYATKLVKLTIVLVNSIITLVTTNLLVWDCMF